MTITEEELKKHKRDVAFVQSCKDRPSPEFAIHTMRKIIFASYTDALECKNENNFQLYSEIIYCEFHEKYLIAYTTPSSLYLKAIKTFLEDLKLEIEQQLNSVRGN